MRIATARAVTLLAMLGAGLCICAAENRERPLRILPLGDSITQSDAQHLGYRYLLWKKLIDAGIQFDFIGSMHPPEIERAPGWIDYQDRAFDIDHEGHSGWTAGDLLDGCSWEPDKGKLPEWLKTYTPDIVLLHIGTNDAFHSVPIEVTVEKIEAIIALLQSDNPKVIVFLAKIIPLAGEWARDYNNAILALNARMDGIAAATTTSDSKVIVVDQYTGFNGAEDTHDSIHPNDSGAEKMAQRWADAILFDGTPITRDDHYNAIQERPLYVGADSGILTNDYASGAPLTASVVETAQNGDLALNPDGGFTYVPYTSFTGSDFFTYQANCNGKLSSVCSVVLDVVSNAPLARDDRFGAAQDITLAVDAASGVLANDVTYRDTLTAVLAKQPENGRLHFNPDGSFEYTPNPGFVGADAFHYSINDGYKTGNIATAHIWNGHQNPVAWWNLDGSNGLIAVDSIDRRYDGALINMNETSWVPDTENRAIRLDGKDDYISVPPLNIETNLLTVTAWVKRDGVQSIFAGIVFWAEGNTLSGLGLGSGYGWEPNHELGYFWHGSYWNWHSELILPDNEWCLAALVVTPTQATLYLGQDGVVTSAVNNRPHDPEQFNVSMRIGDNAQTESRFFKGLMRDVRIYDRPLTPEEINRLAAGPLK